MLSATVFEHGEVGYFLRPFESRLERYDIARETWQTPINLTGVVGTPKVALVDDDGIYAAFDVAFGNAVYRYNTDGSGRTLLLHVAGYVNAIHSDGDVLLIHHSGYQFVSINKSTNTVIDTRDSFNPHTGSSISKEMNRLFTRSGISLSDIGFIAYDDAGMFISEGESPYHGDFPDFETTWVFPGGMKVVNNSGEVYAGANLARLSNFDTTITDIDFLGTDVPIVLGGNKLTTYSPSILPTGSVTLGYTPLEIFVNNTDVITFTADAASETGFRADIVPLSSFQAPTPGLPVNPVGLAFTPDKVELAADGRVMLFSKSLESIFLWNPLSQTYDTTIPLIGTPNDMAYSSVTNTIYVAYGTGLIRKIDLANGNLNEVPFTTVPYGAYLAAAGQYLFASSSFHYSFAPDGREVDVADQHYFSSKNVWSDANQKLYFIREGVSPTDVAWEEINANGVTYPSEPPGGIGRQQDSPLHTEGGFLGPVRVAPDGSIAVLGSGKIHDARTLARLPESLANTVTDAAWLGSELFTIRTFAGAAQIQQWINPTYTVGEVLQTAGSAHGLLAIAANRLLAITLDSQGVPQFTVFDASLAEVDVPLELSATAIAENLPVGTVVGTLSTADTEGGTFAYSLVPGVGEGSNSSFTIDGNQLKTAAILDLEAQSSHSIRVRSTNEAGGSIERAFSIRVTNVNEPPTITSGGGAQTASIGAAENSTAVITVTATDPDAGSTLTYSISGGADAARFSLSTSGFLRFVSLPDFENPTDADRNNIYEVEVRVSDGALTDTQTISVTVANGNDSPIITSNGGGTSANVNVTENATTVTDVDATDVDPQTTLTYGISGGGADATFFSIDSTTGVLTFVSAPDFENPTDLDENNVYFVIVRVSDGSLTDSQTIRVTVTNLNNEPNDSPRITSNGAGAKASISVAENVLAVTDVNADDDGTAPLSYSISGTDAGLFTINSSTGELLFSSPPNFENPADADGNNVYNILVSVTDGSLTDTQTITVTVTNVNEPPVFKHGNVAYFLRPGIASLERYDIASEAWISPINLAQASGAPTIAHADDDGIYVAFDKAVYRYNLDGTGQTHLLDAPSSVSAFHTDGSLLFVAYDRGFFLSFNKTTRVVIDEFLTTYTLVGSSISTEVNRIFVRTQNAAPSDIRYISYDDAGNFTGDDDSPYHGNFPTATTTWVFPGGIRVVDDSGVAYATDNLSQLNRFASRIADIDFHGTNIPIVLSGAKVTAYTSGIVPAGSVSLPYAPQDIFVNATDVIAFTPDAASNTGYRTDIIPLANLDAPTPDQSVDPVDLPFTPDKIELASDGTVLLFSKAHQSIFRFDPATQSFGTTIPLRGTPNIMAYSSATNTAYLAYSTGLINRIDLGAAQPAEVPFVTLPSAATGMTTARQYLFVSIVYKHHTFSPDGTLVEARTSQIHYTSARYVWNDANQKLYFLRESTSPNDLQWEELNADGTTYPGEPPGGIGRQQDSLLHDSSGFTEPVRVAPDGSVVVLGSGKIHDARRFARLTESLSNTITDAAWIGGELFTIRTTAGAAQIQKWKRSSYALEKAVPLPGSAHALLTLSADRLLGITLDSQGVPQFTMFDQNLDVIVGPLSSSTIAENMPAGSGVGTLRATDAESGQALTHMLVTGAGDDDNASFTIDGNALKTAASFDFEAKSRFTIRVRSTDEAGGSTEQTFSISITNVNESPTITSGGGNETLDVDVPENSTAVTNVDATDPDTGSTLTYAISGGAEAAMFSINSTTGALRFISAPDFENPTDAGNNNVYDVVVRVSDGGLTATQTMTVTITGVNEAPSFTKGTDQWVTEGSPAQSIDGWATSIVAGPGGTEAGQILHFVVINDRQDLFVDQPALDAIGKLTFTPAANVEGSARITIELKDDGGTANGGADTSPPQTFTIHVTGPHRWHNTIMPMDANGDGQMTADDALTVINYLNAFGAGPVPTAAVSGPPYRDVNGDDYVAAGDALDIINYLNAFGPTVPSDATGEGESAGMTVCGEGFEGDWLSLMAMDVAVQAKRRRM